jgi:2-keto-4-pentenoate hydratase/2-oxohepta-3-ene-1,7-dioic acid hydratase in catechol pathway
MRFVTYHHLNNPAERVGRVADERIYGLEPGVTLLSLLGDDGERLARAGERALADPREVVELEMVRVLAPIPRPPTVRDFYAFEEHVANARKGRGAEMDPDWYQLPVFYFSNPYATIGTEDSVPIPPGCQALDYELEVAAIIGQSGANLRPEVAEQHIAGFTILNDWSARDLQRREMRQSLGPAKGKDTATSLGPYLVTPDELVDCRKDRGYDLDMVARVNGKEYSRNNWSAVYWSFGEMLAYASRGTRIEPGDVIGSGTCGRGCILELSILHGSEAYPWLRVGDQVELSVDRLGTLKNQVVEGPPLHALR